MFDSIAAGRYRLVVLFCLLIALLPGCKPDDGAAPAAQSTAPSATAAAEPTATPTPLPSPTATPLPTPTPTPGPADVLAQLNPSLALIRTAHREGSGFVIEGQYVVTTARAVWPSRTVEVVFADGSSERDVPVRGWDMLADLAVIGPLAADRPPPALADGEQPAPDGVIYKVGFESRSGQAAQTSVAEVAIDGVLEGDSAEITYFQVSPAPAGELPGSVLVTQTGDVIALAGYRFPTIGLNLAASAVDIKPRLDALIADAAVSEIDSRLLMRTETAELHRSFTLAYECATHAAVIDAPAGSRVTVRTEPEVGFAPVVVLDGYGRQVAGWDRPDTVEREDRLAFTTEQSGPYFVITDRVAGVPQFVNQFTNVAVMHYDDPDDGGRLRRDAPVTGMIDYPGDRDCYRIRLQAGDVVDLRVQSFMVDVTLRVLFPGVHAVEQVVSDYNSGGGMLGQNARLVYEAPYTSDYYIVVDAQTQVGAVGGYRLLLTDPASDAPRPRRPQLPATVETPYGPMALYVAGDDIALLGHPYPATMPIFTFAYPATLLPIYAQGEPRMWTMCASGRCFSDSVGKPVLVIRLHVVPEEAERLSPEVLQEVALDTYQEIKDAGMAPEKPHFFVTQDGDPGFSFVFSDWNNTVLIHAMIADADNNRLLQIGYLLPDDAGLAGWREQAAYSLTTVRRGR